MLNPCLRIPDYLSHLSSGGCIGHQIGHVHMKYKTTLTPQTALSLRDKAIATLVVSGFLTAVLSLTALLQMQPESVMISGETPVDTVIETQQQIPTPPATDTGRMDQLVRP